MPVFAPPAPVVNQYPGDRFVFVGCCDERVRPENGRLAGKTAALDVKGQMALDLETQPSDGLPYQYTLEGDVEDVSRQHIAGRASFVVHPAPWYIGLKRPSLFVDQKDGVSTAVVAVAPDGKPIAGVRVSQPSAAAARSAAASPQSSSTSLAARSRSAWLSVNVVMLVSGERTCHRQFTPLAAGIEEQISR